MKKLTHTKKAIGKVARARKTAIEIGTGLAAVGAVAAVAGYYFYGSKTAKKNRKTIAKWATNMKREVIRETKRLTKNNPKAVAAVVDRVAKAYQDAHSVNAAEVKRVAKELKANWDIVQREAKNTARKNVRKAVSRAKAVRKRV